MRMKISDAIEIEDPKSKKKEEIDKPGEVQGQENPRGVNVDELLENVVGTSGLWQWSILILLAVSCSSITTFSVYANSFSPYRCKMEEVVENYIEKSNLSFGDVATRIGPWSSGTIFDKKAPKVRNGCARYKFNWTTANLDSMLQSNETVFNQSTTEIESCPLGYVYEKSDMHYPGNVVKEFATVCEKSWLVPLGTSLYIAGMSFGFMAGGWSGGKFGRKKTLIIFAIVEFLSGIWTSLSPDYYNYVAARAIMGLGSTAKYSVAAIYAMELTVAKHRSLFRAVLQLGLTFFYRGVIALFAYLIPNWRWLNIAATAPNFLSFLYFFLPESPRWLISQNRERDAVIVLKSGYRVNHLGKPKVHKRRLDDLIEETSAMVVSSPAGDSEPKHWGLPRVDFRAIRAKYDIKSAILCTIAMCGVSLSYFGLLFYARVVRNYIYLVGFLNALMTLPDNILFALLYRFCRHRKLPLLILVALSVFVCAGTGMFTLFAKPSTDIVLTVCSNIILIITHASLTMLFVYIPELFASNVRAQMSGLIMGLGRFGSMLCTFVNELDSFAGHGMPLVAYCGVLISVFISILFLRDTTGENLPDK
ncbi:unnamed protein product [Calicophoron daubneyi]|uniref:Major facilitator superfamily (MFS) profile domain-containing protein n=1 Tax=Calicophoron daubneyi TaxID=300641 RepID=A0AAV2TJM5_CALDB